jgi:hypothetical protein
VEIDYLKETDEIIKQLKLHGKSELSEAIKNVVDGAATGTELIMGVKYNLEKNARDIPENISPKVKKLIEYIDSQLE